MKPRHTLLVALPIAALAVSGCGGGSSAPTESAPVTTAATTTALTKAALIEQGDAICAEVNAAVGTVGSSSAEASAPAAQVADLYSGMVSSLENLGAPQEADGYAEFTSAADELATAEGEVKLAADRSDTAGLESAESSASAALSSFQAVAQEYGFKECAEGPRAPVASGTTEAGESESAEAPEEAEAVEPEAEVEAAPEVAPETGGAGGTGGGTAGGTEGSGTAGGESGGIGPG
ncbi:MAG TPA: hypothetical protein VHR65_09010 [Solirubrobacterales bacterium]|jgi:hypothetical protein|nr:hypothetical protein [Solirubrobacterales bacterium]